MSPGFLICLFCKIFLTKVQNKKKKYFVIVALYFSLFEIKETWAFLAENCI